MSGVAIQENTDQIRARSWRTEGLLRLLENVLSVGENPEELIVYAALGKAARDQKSHDIIRKTLLELEDDQSLLIQSGKPIGVFPTHKGAPRVMMANCNLVGRWATADHFYKLYDENLIAWGGLTAGCWQYIGAQGVLQGTFETFSAVARTHFDQDDLTGRWVVTAGLGGMGSAQPLALTMLGGVALVAEVNADRAQARMQAGLCDQVTDDLEQAVTLCEQARKDKKPLSVTWIGNTVDMLEYLLEHGHKPDVVTDMTSAHDPLYGYYPVDMSVDEAAAMRKSNPDELIRRARATMVRHVKALLSFKDAGQVVFDYGNNLRSGATEGGAENAFDIKVFTELYLRPLFCRGIGPYRWIALSGNEDDIAWIDQKLLELFPENKTIQRWITEARKKVPLQGLPARIAWLGHGERTKLALAVNEAVADGTLKGPVAFTRDHLDAGGMAHPNIMTENLKDGTDAVADWPLLNALLMTASGADLVAIHSGGGGYAGYMTSAGLTVIADGSDDAGERLERVQTADTGWGVLRYADAGYEDAIETAHKIDKDDDIKVLNLEEKETSK